MKRLITVFLLAAALFVLMGCGMKSKNQPQIEPTVHTETEMKTFALPMGAYLGSGGPITHVDPEKDALLAARMLQLEVVSAQLSDLREVVDVASLPEEDQKKHQNALRELEEQRQALAGEISGLENELIALRVRSLGFSISKNEAGNIEMSDLKIETDKDIPVFALKYKKNEDGEFLLDEEGNKIVETDEAGNSVRELDENGEPIIERVEHFFGDSIALNNDSVVSFDEKSGGFKFSFDHEGLVYTFDGQVREETINEKTRSVLEGDVRVSGKEKTDEVLQTGSWKVIYQPTAREIITESAPAVAKKATEIVKGIAVPVKEESGKTEGENSAGDESSEEDKKDTK